MKSHWLRALASAAMCAATMPFATASGTKEDKGKVVAKVNGAEIYERDLYSAAQLESMPGESRNKFLQQTLDQAIENELLYQEAKKKGLDKDPKYLESLERQKKMTAQRKVQMLASYYEQSIESLKTARDREAITEEEIYAYYEENKARYKRRSEERAKQIIRSQLVSIKYREAYGKWLQDIVGRCQVEINGTAIPDGVMLQAVKDNFNAAQRNTRPDQDGAVDPLWQAVADAAGVDLLEATKEPPNLGEPNPFKEKLSSLTFKIGETEVNWSEVYQLDALLNTPSTAHYMAGPEVFYVLKTYIVAEEAKKSGIEEDPDYKKRLTRSVMDPIMSNMSSSADAEKRLLIKHLNQDAGLYDTSKHEVTPAEIDDYYAKNGHQYARLEKRPNGKDRVRKVIERTLKSQKAKGERKAYIQNLREAGEVERID